MTFLLMAMLPGAGAQAPCDTAYDLNRMLDTLTQAERALAERDIGTTEALAEKIHDDASCLPDVVRPGHLVRYGRVRALLAHLQGEDTEVGYWGQLALLDRDLRWPAGIDGDFPGRERLDLMARRAARPLPDRGLAAPEGGGIIVDGLAVTRPTASPEAPHLVQVMAADGRLVETAWQDGSIWSESMLTYDPTPIELPLRYAAPNAKEDPYAPVVLTARVAERREVERVILEERTEAQDALLARARAKEERAARKRERRKPREPVPPAGIPGLDRLATAAPSAGPPSGEVVSVRIDANLGTGDLLERGRSTAACDDVLTVEARSMVGALTEAQILCLQTRLATAPKQTTRAQISRALMADAWAKGNTDRWEAAMVRHLERIDRSDADLAFILATWLASRGTDKHAEAVRWATAAQENAHQWVGDVRIERVEALHRIDSLAARALWFTAEAEHMAARRASSAEEAEEAARAAGYWRAQTKTLAREWLQFATEAGVDVSEPFEVCLAAAGTAEFCEVL